MRLKTNLTILLFVIALVPRLLIIALAPNVNDAPAMDWVTYTAIADNILDGNGFSLDGVRPTDRVGPLYPGFIAATYALSGHSNTAVKILQAVLGAFTVVLLYWTAKHLFEPRVALVSALILAFHPELAAVSAFLYTETVFIVLLVLAVFLTLRGIGKDENLSLIGAGIVFGLAALCRGLLIPLPGFLFIAFLIMKVRWRQVLRWTLLITLPMGLTIFPWTLRNYTALHEFVPVSEGLGNSLFVGNYLPFDGRHRYEESDRLAKQITSGASSLAQADKRLLCAALDGMREHPLASGWLILRKAGRLWFEVYENVPSGAKRTVNWLVLLVLGTWHYALVGFALIGSAITRKSLRSLAVVYAVLLLITVVYAFTLAIPRYRMPMMPYVSMLAAVGLCSTWDALGKLRKKRTTNESMTQ